MRKTQIHQATPSMQIGNLETLFHSCDRRFLNLLISRWCVRSGCRAPNLSNGDISSSGSKMRKLTSSHISCELKLAQAIQVKLIRIHIGIIPIFQSIFKPENRSAEISIYVLENQYMKILSKIYLIIHMLCIKRTPYSLIYTGKYDFESKGISLWK